MRDNLAKCYSAHKPLLEELANNLELEIAEILSNTKHIDRISFRVKDIDSFIAKALDQTNDPPYTNPAIEIEDQVAGRVIVFFISDINEVLKKINANFNEIEVTKRRPPKDEEFGYESHHIICTIPSHLKPKGWDAENELPATFEIQIRTIFMHAYAEPQHDIGYKSTKDLPPTIRRELAWIAASAWGADNAYNRIANWNNSQQN